MYVFLSLHGNLLLSSLESWWERKDGFLIFEPYGVQFNKLDLEVGTTKLFSLRFGFQKGVLVMGLCWRSYGNFILDIGQFEAFYGDSRSRVGAMNLRSRAVVIWFISNYFGKSS